MSLSQALTLFGWTAAAALVGMMLLIARFFQRTSGQRSAYPLFAFPALLLLAVGLRRAFYAEAADADSLADGLGFVAGTVTLLQCYWLFRLMTGRRD